MIQITFTGTLGRDAEEKEFGSNKVVVFSAAVNERKKDSNGEYVETTTWVDVLYGRGSGILSYLKKGTRVLIQGTPKVNAYMNRDNQPVASLSVSAHTVELIGGKTDSQQAPQHGNASQQGSPFGKQTSDDNLPF